MENYDCFQIFDARALQVASNEVAVRFDFGEERTQFTRSGKEAIGKNGSLAVIKE